jgi:hypothetical protein
VGAEAGDGAGDHAHTVEAALDRDAVVVEQRTGLRGLQLADPEQQQQRLAQPLVQDDRPVGADLRHAQLAAVEQVDDLQHELARIRVGVADLVATLPQFLDPTLQLGDRRNLGSSRCFVHPAPKIRRLQYTAELP